MLRHIVMIKFKDEVDVKSASEELREMLLDLESSISFLLNMEVGLNISNKPSAFDIVLTADFENEAGLDEYRVHYEHVKVLEYLKKVMEKAQVVDYII
jgi:stress responsive alpha/beta barrel protein